MGIETNQFLKTAIEKAEINLSIASFSNPVGANWNYNIMPQSNSFYYIKSGEGKLTIGENEYYPKSGQMVLLPYGIPYTTSVISENTFVKYWCSFTANYGNCDLFQLLKIPCCVDIVDIKKIEHLFIMLLEASYSNSYAGVFEQKSILYEIIYNYFLLCGENNIKHVDPFVDNRILTVLNYIENNINSSISTNELAKHVFLSSNCLINLFKKNTGMTPLNYIFKIKLDKAKFSLTFSEKSIKEIADEIGMEPLYFSRVFKKHFGISPTIFRKKNDYTN